MKYLFILLAVFNYNVVYSQKYQPLVEEGKYWIYFFKGGGDNPCNFNWIVGAQIHHFGIDTLINDTIYKKVLVSRLKQGAPMSAPVLPYEITSTIVMGYIREDTLTKKVYLIPNGYFYNPCKEEIRENLFFDFSLEQGDTLNECLRNSIERFGNPDVPFYPVVDSVKYEIDQFGIKRKHFYSFGYFEPCYFLHSPGFVMEGFGFLDGPFRGGIDRELINYCEGTLADCNIISSTKDITTNSNQLKIYPNPTNSLLHIDGLNAEASIIIQHINGQIIKTVTTIDSQIDISDLPNALYIFEIQNKDVNERHKVVKIE